MSSSLSSSATDVCSPPEVGTDGSRGSSISTPMREEYEDLLRYAVVMPVLNTTLDASKLEASTAGGGGGGPRGESPAFRTQPEPVPVSMRPSVQPRAPLSPLNLPEGVGRHLISHIMYLQWNLCTY